MTSVSSLGIRNNAFMYRLCSFSGAKTICDKSKAIALLKQGGWFDATNYPKYDDLNKRHNLYVFYNRYGKIRVCSHEERNELLNETEWSQDYNYFNEEEKENAKNDKQKTKQHKKSKYK